MNILIIRYNNDVRLMVNVDDNIKMNTLSRLYQDSDRFIWNHDDAVIINSVVCDQKHEEYTNIIVFQNRNKEQNKLETYKNSIIVCTARFSQHESIPNVPSTQANPCNSEKENTNNNGVDTTKPETTKLLNQRGNLLMLPNNSNSFGK